MQNLLLIANRKLTTVTAVFEHVKAIRTVKTISFITQLKLLQRHN